MLNIIVGCDSGVAVFDLHNKKCWNILSDNTSQQHFWTLNDHQMQTVHESVIRGPFKNPKDGERRRKSAKVDERRWKTADYVRFMGNSRKKPQAIFVRIALNSVT